jgi:hypothetical protein
MTVPAEVLLIVPPLMMSLPAVGVVPSAVLLLMLSVVPGLTMVSPT